MNHFLKIILFTLFNFTLIDQSYGQDLKYKAEALLDLTAIEYKALANNGDYDSVGFKVAVSPLILGAVIWNTKGELIFPLQDYWAPVSQEMARSDLHRMEPLLESASLTAWEKRTVDGSSLLYCRKDTMSLCLIVATEVLAQQLGHEQQFVLEQVLNKQPKQLFFTVFSYFIYPFGILRVVCLAILFEQQKSSSSPTKHLRFRLL